MRNHQDRDAVGLERAQDVAQHALGVRVQPLGRLVHQQDARLEQQHLRDGALLLLAAAEVVGMLVQQRGDADFFGDRRNPRVPLLLFHALRLEQLGEVVAETVADENRLRILRQQRQIAAVQRAALVIADGTAADANLPPIGAVQTGEDVEGGGLAGPVAAEQAVKLALVDAERSAAQDVRQAALVAEEHVFHLQRGLAVVYIRRRRVVAGGGRFGRKKPLQKVPALADGQRTRAVLPERVENADGAGQAELHRMRRREGAADIARSIVQQYAALVHQQHLVGDGEHLLQPVLDQQHGQSQLVVELAKRGDEIGGGDGVKLAGRLVEDEQLGLHHHHRGEVQKLLLAAGERIRVAAEQILNAEIAGHFAHAAADDLGRQAQIFQPEGQLVPDLVGHNLVVGILQHIADLARLGALGERRLRDAAVIDFAAARAGGRERALEQPQQRRFPAARFAADDDKLAALHAQADAVDSVLRRRRIAEAHIFEM